MSRKLRLCIHYRDVFGMDNAVPAESKALAMAMAGHAHVTMIGREKPQDLRPAGVECLTYTGWRGLWGILAAQRKQDADALILQAPLTVEALFVLLCCTLVGLPVVIQDFGQVTSAGMTRKLFGQNPDVRALEAGKAVNRSAFGTWCGNQLSIVKKKIAFMLLRCLDNHTIRGWITFSVFSREEHRKLLGVEPGRCVMMPWPALPVVFTKDDTNWFDSTGKEMGVFRIVMWSRLDYWMKGIDRVLNGFALARERDVDFRNEARIYLIGPSYQGGCEKTQEHIDRLSLGGHAEWLGPDQYPKGSLSPLADADASILLSRWDGFPRALRESLGLGVPVIVSPETHFGDLIGEFGCGECVQDPDSSSCVADTLLSAFRGFRQIKTSGAPGRAHQSLNGDRIGRDAASQLCRLLDVK